MSFSANPQPRDIRISINGNPCIIPPDDQLGYYLSLRNLPQFEFDNAHAVAPTTTREFYQRVPFTRLNWPKEPELGFNQLYMPTGATRWGKMWVMIDIPALGQDTRSWNLLTGFPWTFPNLRIWSDYNPNIVDCSMAAKWVVQTETILQEPQRQRIVGLLCDERYVMQSLPWTYTDEETIQELFSSINNQLPDGVELISPTFTGWNIVEDNSLAFDKREFARQDLTLMEVIDALATILGLVAVFVPSRINYGVSRFYLQKPNYEPENGLFDDPGEIFDSGEIVSQLLVTRSTTFQFRKKTHWHRFNEDQHELVLERPLGSVPETQGIDNALIQLSAFWSGVEAEDNKLSEYARDWERSWWLFRVQYHHKHFVFLNIGADDNFGYKFPDYQCGNDYTLLSIGPNDATIRLNFLESDFYPNSLLVQNEVVDTWENLIVKTPGGGIPARSGTTLTTASCDIYVLDQDTMTISDSGDNVDVYSIGDAIPGNTYCIAVLMNDGTYAALASGTPGFQIVYVSPQTYPIMPGGSADCLIMDWNGTAFEDSGAAAITVHDSAKQNCVLVGETVQAFESDVTGQYEILGSSGLRRYAKLSQPMIPGRSDAFSAAPDRHQNFADAKLVDHTVGSKPPWNDVQESGGYVDIKVYDPTLHSCVLPGEIVPVHYHSKTGRHPLSSVTDSCWIVEGGHGLVRHGVYSPSTGGNSLAPIAMGDFSLTDQYNPERRNPEYKYMVSAHNTTPFQIKSGAWVTLLWTPYHVGMDTSGQFVGLWLVLNCHAQVIDVILQAKNSGTSRSDWKYDIIDPVSNAVISTDVDPTSGVHKWVRSPGLNYLKANFGQGYWTGAKSNTGAIGQDSVELRWIRETPDTTDCSDTTTEPPPPPPPPPPYLKYYCLNSICYPSNSPVPGYIMYDTPEQCAAACGGGSGGGAGWYCIINDFGERVCVEFQDTPPTGTTIVGGPYPTEIYCSQLCYISNLP